MAFSEDLQAAPQTLAILISGRGSNMIALANACEKGELNARVGVVVSNRADSKGLQAARNMGLPTAVIDHTRFPTRQAFDNAVDSELRNHNPSWIVLAGFMRILSAEFVGRWRGRILNIHPSLLPKYSGLNTHQRAIDAGDTEAGASVHIVTEELDAGPVVAQIKVPVLPEDSSEDLAKRVLAEEHRLYVKALRFCLNKC